LRAYAELEVQLLCFYKYLSLELCRCWLPKLYEARKKHAAGACYVVDAELSWKTCEPILCRFFVA